jgi:predicted short-subunit dehydrogenase-like oxidoreductase (DUF2520 family)
MIDSICVVGAGRVGSALAARLRERGLPVSVTGRELEVGSAGHILLCVPDGAIADVAAQIAPGPWVAHVSGATPLAALAPHTRRFGVHPLQTFTRTRGAEQIDGAFAAVGGETPDALAEAQALAELLGLQPFTIADRDRAAYHAGAAIAASYLVTLQRAASRLFISAGAPPAALTPLIRRTVENGFDLTGPIARGDRATIDAHIAALRERAPGLEPLYRVLADATVELVVNA